jgi:hypothetical protein
MMQSLRTASRGSRVALSSATSGGTTARRWALQGALLQPTDKAEVALPLAHPLSVSFFSLSWFLSSMQRLHCIHRLPTMLFLNS